MNQIFFIHLPVVHIQALSTEVHFLMYTIQSSSSTPDCLPNRSQSMYPHKDLYVNVSRSFTCNSQKLGTTQVCTDEQRNWALSVQWMPLTGKSLLPMIHGDGAQRQLLRPRRHTAGTYCEVACTWDARKCKFIPVTADHCSPRAGAVRRLQQRDFLEVFCVLIGGIVTWIYLSALWAL